MIRSDLPQGWEEGFTPEGATYFIDHNERRTTFIHPQTRHTSPENSAFILQEQHQRPGIMSKPGAELSSISDTSTNITSSNKSLSRPSVKIHSFGKRHQSIKRNPNVPVEVRGWLYKQDSSGMHLWKRKWFVLADYCLFYYKDSREQSVLGSIPLPSYEVSPVGPQDHISRKFAFKVRHSRMRTHLDKRGALIGSSKHSSLIGSQAEHMGMRTYLFSADTQDDMNTWIEAMNRASRVQNQVQNQVQTETQIQTQVWNGVRAQNGVHCGTNTAKDRSSDLLNHKDQSSSEKTLVHEVQLEPISLQNQTKTSPRTSSRPDLDQTSSSVSAPISRAPSQTRFPSDFSRNGLGSSPSPILEPNGIAAGTYQKSPPPSALSPQTPRLPTSPGSSLKPPSLREQVQNWVKVQKEEYRGALSRDSTLHRKTPPAQFSPIDPDYNPPAGRSGEYRYAQDRLSHLGLSDPGPTPPSFVQLYEWQQRHRYRHGNPTAPLYNPAPLYPYGPRPLTATDQSGATQMPRCISVPPSSNEVPPTLCTGPMSRRPHTPAERLTVKPTNERASFIDRAFTASPRRSSSQLFKSSTMERRSLPASGHMTHTVSAPSLHGKTPEELTLLLIQLRRHQTNMAALRRETLNQIHQQTGSHFLSDHTHFLSISPAHHSPHGTQVDDTYLQLKKDLEYLDLKVGGSQQLKEVKPVKVAESDIDVKLSRLCEQDRTLKELEVRISALKDDKDKLESVLDVSHQQMEQFSDLSSKHKISLQQRLLQEDLVQLRAQLSRGYTDMSVSWGEYLSLEKSVEALRSALEKQMDLPSTSQQERSELKRELWRIEDVMTGLSSSKNHNSITIQSVLHPERKLVPSVQESVPSTWVSDPAPPRPPLPYVYDDDDSPPEVPPLPKEASVIRHTSVRGLKRQSDERRRDREGCCTNEDWKFQSDLRLFLSEPELPAANAFRTTDVDQPYPCTGLQGSSSGLNQSSVSAFVTLRRGATHEQERPLSAFECSSSSSPALDSHWSSSVQSRGRMSADEQLHRLKLHQRAMQRDRQRSLSHMCTMAEQVCARAPPPTPKRSSSKKRSSVIQERLGQCNTEY